jgi:hypothetical protein
MAADAQPALSGLRNDRTVPERIANIGDSMVEVIIIIVLLVVGFPLAVVAASHIEPDSPTGAPPTPIAE